MISCTHFEFSLFSPIISQPPLPEKRISTHARYQSFSVEKENNIKILAVSESVESNSLIVKIPNQKSKEKKEVLKRQDQIRKKNSGYF